MMKSYRIGLIAAVLCLSLSSGAPLYAAASVEEAFERINRLPARERAEALEREARKEGQLIWYGAMNVERSARAHPPL